MDATSQTIIFLLQVGALWVFFIFMVRRYAIERLRENLFAIRDKLFDEVAGSDRNFRSEDYVHLRSYINQVIRMGHMITPIRAVLYDLLVCIPGVTGGVSKEEMRQQVNEQITWLRHSAETNPRVKRVHTEVHMQLMQYYCLTSPVFLCVLIVAIIFVMCSMGLRGLKNSAELAFDRFFGSNIDRGISSSNDGEVLAVC